LSTRNPPLIEKKLHHRPTYFSLGPSPQACLDQTSQRVNSALATFIARLAAEHKIQAFARLRGIDVANPETAKRARTIKNTLIKGKSPAMDVRRQCQLLC